MGRLFGTDGARGVANSELTCELALQIGRAAAMVLIDGNKKRPKVMIGMDTRISSNMLCSAITAGLCSVGADVMHLGVLPTPAVAYLVKKYKYDAAVMITASHNPCEYNGIKIFQKDGFKLPDELEEKIFKNERTEKLKKSIQKLKIEYQNAIYLADIEELSYKEIAHILKKTDSSVKVLIYRAREALRKVMIEEGMK